MRPPVFTVFTDLLQYRNCSFWNAALHLWGNQDSCFIDAKGPCQWLTSEAEAFSTTTGFPYYLKVPALLKLLCCHTGPPRPARPWAQSSSPHQTQVRLQVAPSPPIDSLACHYFCFANPSHRVIRFHSVSMRRPYRLQIQHDWQHCPPRARCACFPGPLWAGPSLELRAPLPALSWLRETFHNSHLK